MQMRWHVKMQQDHDHGDEDGDDHDHDHDEEEQCEDFMSESDLAHAECEWHAVRWHVKMQAVITMT